MPPDSGRTHQKFQSGSGVVDTQEQTGTVLRERSGTRPDVEFSAVRVRLIEGYARGDDKVGRFR